MFDKTTYGQIKIAKLLLPKRLLSRSVKEADKLTILAMWVRIHFFSKSGVIKFSSVAEACEWFGISKSTYYRVSKHWFFKFLFKAEKGCFSAKSIRKTKEWRGRLIALNGLLNTADDYKLGIDVTENSLKTINGIKDLLRSALLVSQISSFDVKREDGGGSDKNLIVGRETETNLGMRASVAKIDDNVRPIAYFQKLIGCSKTKTRDLLHKLNKEGVIGIQPIRKSIHESYLKADMVASGKGIYDVLDEANKWNYAHTYGKTAMPYFGFFITQLPNRYWITQRRIVEGPNGKVSKIKKHSKSIHVPDCLWNPEYGTKEDKKSRKNRKKKTRSYLEEQLRMIEAIDSSLRKEAKDLGDGKVLFRGQTLSKEEFEKQLDKLKKQNVKRANENAQKAFEPDTVYKSNAPKSKLTDEVVYIDYKSLSTVWTPVPTNEFGYKDYRAVSKDVERYDRYISLTEEERRHLDNHPEIDLATEDGRKLLKNHLKANRAEMMSEGMMKRFKELGMKTAQFDQEWSEEEQVKAAKKFIEADNYFFDSGRSLKTRIDLAKKRVKTQLIEDTKESIRKKREKYLKEAEFMLEQGEASLYFDYLQYASEVRYPSNVIKRTLFDLLADDEEKELIDKDVVTVYYVTELRYTYHRKDIGTDRVGLMLDEWRKARGIRRKERDEERRRKKEEKERLKQERLELRRRRKEVQTKQD